MNMIPQIDSYINQLPEWQQTICKTIRQWIHEAEPNITEEIKFTNRPYFTYKGNVMALLAAKDHVNVFVYDPIAADPKKLINQGHANTTARSIQIRKDRTIDKAAFVNLVKSIIKNNDAGGWRKIK